MRNILVLIMVVLFCGAWVDVYQHEYIQKPARDITVTTLCIDGYAYVIASHNKGIAITQVMEPSISKYPEDPAPHLVPRKCSLQTME